MTAARNTIFEVIEEAGVPNPWRDTKTFAAVGPNGEFNYRHVVTNHPDLANEKIGVQPIALLDGTPMISAQYRSMGWVLYEDLCRGAVPGVEASPAHWTYWKKYVAVRASGRAPARGSIRDEEFFHPEVLRRRARAGGPASVDLAGMRELLGFGAGDEEEEETPEFPAVAPPAPTRESLGLGPKKPTRPKKPAAKDPPAKKPAAGKKPTPAAANTPPAPKSIEELRNED
jgi:hypothetical protein